MRRVMACLGIAAAMFFATQPAAGAAPSDVDPQAFGEPVINEVQTRGSAGTMDQFIEILNPSSTKVADLSGWTIQVYSSANVVLQTIFIPDGVSLLPLGSGPTEESLWTVSSTAFTGGAVDQPGAIAVDIPSNGGLALFNPGAVNKVDGLAFSAGATSALEATPQTPQPASLDTLNPAYGRNIIGRDTNNNLNDFRLLTRSPEALN